MTYPTGAAPADLYTPQGSSTQQTGYINNSAVQGNNDWRAAAMQTLAYQWASTPPNQRGNFLQPAWAQGAVNGESQFGRLGTTDGVGADGSVYTSPQTLAALSRFLNQYQPGSAPQLDSILPYIPPQENEYVESPEQVANRVAQWNADRDFGLQMSQEERAQRALDIQREIALAGEAGATARANISAGAQVQAAGIGAGATVEAANIGAAASRYGTQGQFLSSLYGTDANMYNADENNRLNALNFGGQLGLGLQNTYDARTNNIIQNLSNPADFVQRQYSIRALQAPNPEQVTAYQNVPGISQAMGGLLGWQANDEARPNRPELPALAYGGGTSARQFIAGDPQAHGGPNPEVVEVLNPGPRTQARVTPISEIMGMPAFAYGTPTATNPTNNPYLDAQGNPLPGTYGYNTTRNSSGGLYGQNAGAQSYGQSAYQGGGTTLPAPPREIISTPDVDPETGRSLGTSTNTYGPAILPPEPAANPGAYGGGYSSGGGPQANNNDTVAPYMNSPRTPATTIPGGDTTGAGGNGPAAPPPPAATVPPPPTMADTITQILQGLGLGGNTGGQTGAPNTTFPNYTNEQIQDMPSLRYLQGLMPASGYNQISGAFQEGPFGTSLPMGGAMNLAMMGDIARNPDELAQLSSLYRGANLNLDAIIAQALARAPIGQAYRPSMIGT